MERFYAFIREHRWTTLLLLAGFVLFILIITINFWRTLLLLAILSICFLIGKLMDKGGWEMVRAFFDRILPK